jgi:hypothetical protein
MNDPDDAADKRIPLAKQFKDDLGWPKCKQVDVLAFIHGDNDHVKGAAKIFSFEHAEKCQGKDRVKLKEQWVWNFHFQTVPVAQDWPALASP